MAGSCFTSSPASKFKQTLRLSGNAANFKAANNDLRFEDALKVHKSFVLRSLTFIQHNWAIEPDMSSVFLSIAAVRL